MILSYINNLEVKPKGKQKKFLLNLLGTKKCKIVGSNYNGYGYADTNRYYTLSAVEVEEYNRLAPLTPKPKKIKTEEEKLEIWCRRLVKLTSISIEEARDIAEEKLEYKEDRILYMQERQSERLSRQRDKLIAKMERENPLRYIRDVEHAQAILEASNRHNCTNYESLLEEARDKAALGIINKNEIKDYARIRTN